MQKSSSWDVKSFSSVLEESPTPRKGGYFTMYTGQTTGPDPKADDLSQNSEKLFT